MATRTAMRTTALAARQTFFAAFLSMTSVPWVAYPVLRIGRDGSDGSRVAHARDFVGHAILRLVVVAGLIGL